eukprot:7440984-Ditylum_brightwellii.AAC.2
MPKKDRYEASPSSSEDGLDESSPPSTTPNPDQKEEMTKKDGNEASPSSEDGLSESTPLSSTPTPGTKDEMAKKDGNEASPSSSEDELDGSTPPLSTPTPDQKDDMIKKLKRKLLHHYTKMKVTNLHLH